MNRSIYLDFTEIRLGGQLLANIAKCCKTFHLRSKQTCKELYYFVFGILLHKLLKPYVFPKIFSILVTVHEYSDD